jgi:alkylation response protein AidB-like acyl-CoA dehydrogenase
LKAVRDRDAYVMNGAKIWIGGAQFANWMHFMARTGDSSTKHRGISYFMTSRDAPGITVRPIPDMKGDEVFCEIILEDVRVPVTQRVGDENQGWYVATTGLNYQRSSIQNVAQARRYFANVLATLGARAFERRWRRQTTQLAIDLDCARLLSYRVAWMQSVGFLPLHEASIDKVFVTELQQRLTHFAMMALGPAGQLAANDFRAPLDGNVYREHIDAVVGTIGLGSSEIQRTVIANKGLGMPR